MNSVWDDVHLVDQRRKNIKMIGKLYRSKQACSVDMGVYSVVVVVVVTLHRTYRVLCTNQYSACVNNLPVTKAKYILKNLEILFEGI